MKVYLQDSNYVLESQKVSKDGLNDKEAEKRLSEYGKNKLEEAKAKPLIARIWDQIKDPMVLLLIVAGVISGFFGEIPDMIIILIVVVLNAVLGIVQENKAEEAIAALQEMSAPHSKVRRNGNVSVIASEDIVPGDIVLLEAGDSIPADMRLIETASLKIEEAALTGESVPVEKTAQSISGSEDEEIPLGDRVNMAYAGTNVSYGRGEGVVVGTGMHTEMGKIADILSGTTEEKTPLQQKLAGLSKILSIAVIGICIFIFVFSIFQDGDYTAEHILDNLLTAVSLAVAAIPEGLVVVVTILLSIGVTRMSTRNSIIRRLTAVETLGCTQVICSDKTGTLTQNKMTVVDSFGDEALLATAMGLCNDVVIDAESNFVGDPTEIALVEYANKAGLNDLKTEHKRIGEAPFDSDRKMMSTVHSGYFHKIKQFTKGAPDEVLKCCDNIYIDGEVIPLTDEMKTKVISENKAMADKALRVLGAAYRDYDKAPDDFDANNLENSLTFIGLTGMIDPIRPEVKDAILECRAAGIKAVMITGDHRDTAVAIAKDLGILADESQAITGAELSKMSDKEFEKRIGEISVYARVQPEHKVRIVKMWKKKGKITAMTGDGVNDAPALKTADIGVGMGITGTDVTKNVADMVLSDDNFASIVYAVDEGRRIYDNILKAIQYLLSANLAEVLSIFIATILSLKLFSPIQLLWINLVTDTFPAMALGMEESESDSMLRPPRPSNANVFSDGLGVHVVMQGIVIGVLTLWSFFVGNTQSHTIGMTMAFLTLSMCEIFHALNMRSRRKSIFSLKTHNKLLYGAMVLSFALTIAVIYIPGLNVIFDMTSLSVQNFFGAVGIAFIIIPLVEIAKIIDRAVRK